MADWAAAYQGTFTSESLEDTLTRQTGQYRVLRNMTPLQQKNVCEDVCRGCVRVPTWANLLSEKMIPCREACNVWLSAALGNPDP